MSIFALHYAIYKKKKKNDAKICKSLLDIVWLESARDLMVFRMRMRCAKRNTTTKKMNGSNDNELWLNKVHIKIEFIKSIHVEGTANAVAIQIGPNTAR